MKKQGRRKIKTAAIFVGMTGFEPATSRPPAVRSSQTEPHSEIIHNYNIRMAICKGSGPFIFCIFWPIYKVQGNVNAVHIYKRKDAQFVTY